MTNLTKNTEMTTAQKITAFDALGGYIKLNPSIEIVVDLFDKYSKQVIVKAKMAVGTYSVIIGTRGAIIASDWS
jgi:hypothetical protein